MANKKKDQPNGESAGPGHNSGGLTDDQRISLVHQHSELIAEAKRVKDKAVSDLRLAKQKAKADLGASGLTEIEHYQELATPEGEKRFKADIEARVRVARWVGLPVGTQGEIFPSNDPAPATERARAAGKLAGLTAKPRKPPHDPSVPQYKAWIEGYDEGQAVNAAGIKAPQPGAAAEKAVSFSDAAAAGDQLIKENEDRLAQQAH